MKRILAVVVAAVVLSGCASLQSETEAWMGHDKDELIAAWGPPLAIQSDGQGGEVLYYTLARYPRQRVFIYVHKNGMLYYWRIR